MYNHTLQHRKKYFCNYCLQAFSTEEILKHTKVRLSPSKKKTFFICFNDSPSKIMKIAFYFILNALFVFKIFNFRLDCLVEKTV